MYTNNLNLKTIIDKSNKILVIGQSCIQQDVAHALEADYQIIALDGQIDLLTQVIGQLDKPICKQDIYNFFVKDSIGGCHPREGGDPWNHADLKIDPRSESRVTSADKAFLQKEAINAFTTRSYASCIIIEYTPEILPEIYALKEHFLTYSIPIIAVTSTLCAYTINQMVHAGIDDFIQRPIDTNQLRMRVHINTTRSLRNQNANPLTKLPGNELISTTITQRLNQPFAMVYADLDHFKAYNDAYGFAQGDQLLLALAQILVHTTQKIGNPTDFVGHIGGDDFAIISTPDKAELIAQEICLQFDQQAPSFYNDHDRAQKKIITFNRQGYTQEFPLITLSCAIASNGLRILSCVAQVAQIIAELKCYAKGKPDGVTRSNYVKDRRTK